MGSTKALIIVFALLAFVCCMILVLYAKAYVALYIIKRLIMLGVLP